jgi:hypothetical protein
MLPKGKTCLKLVVYSNLVDTTLTLHTPKSHTQHSLAIVQIIPVFYHASIKYKSVVEVISSRS